MKKSLPVAALLVACFVSTNPATAQDPPKSNKPHALGGDPFNPSQRQEPEVGVPLNKVPVEKGSKLFRNIGTARQENATKALEAKLQQELELKGGTMPMSEFVAELSQAIKAPVFLQSHSEWTEVNDETSITLKTSGLPLGAELQKALRPHSLRAIVHDGVLLIVPDTQELARRGIGTSRYVTRDDNYMRELDERLSQSYSQSFNEIPLQDAVRILSTETEIKFLIDNRALEDLGLTRDVPVTIDLSEVSVYSFLQLMLRDADLTLMPRDGYVLVTTRDEVQEPSNLIGRVYWLDGTGLSPEAAAEAIESVIEPDTWEMLGGTSSLVQLNAKEHGRPGLVISTQYSVHHAIENLLQSIRHGVVDPRTTYAEREHFSKGFDWRGAMGMGGMGMGGPAVIGGPAPAGGAQGK